MASGAYLAQQVRGPCAQGIASGFANPGASGHGVTEG